MESELEPYRAMWSTEKDMWVLERTRGGGLLPMRRGDPPHALLIEDDDLAVEVCRRMQVAGVEVVGVIGREMAEATASEVQHRLAHRDKESPLRDIAYDPIRGDLSLHTFVTSHTDSILRDFAKGFGSLAPDRQGAVRASLTMDDFYTLLTFARRCAIASLRERNAGIGADGVTAVTAIDAERVDWRDVTVAAALLSFALRRANADSGLLFAQASERAEPKAAEILRRFAHETVDSLAPWGYRLVETSDGAVLFEDEGHRYEPSVDLTRIVLRLAAMVEGDAYRATGIGLGSAVARVWVPLGDPTVISSAIASLSGCAILHAALRPSVHPSAKSQQFTVFLAEAASREDAQVLAAAGSVQGDSGHEGIGLANGRLVCIAIARSFVKGTPGYERSGSLDRFKPAITALLQ